MAGIKPVQTLPWILLLSLALPHSSDTSSGRLIQPKACSLGSARGVCMFAANCENSGGEHLGICIDRVYYGSCCRLPGKNNSEGVETSIENNSEGVETAIENNSEGVETAIENMTYQEACGRQPWLEVVRDRVPKIQEGNRAQYGEWPWQISLQVQIFKIHVHKCGAVLVSREWAVTAAHCVHNQLKSELLLRMGEYRIDSVGPSPEEAHSHQDRKISEIVKHSMYNRRTHDYDIAMLRLDQPVQFQPNILPVCLPGGLDLQDIVGQEAWVTGYGSIYEDGPNPNILQKVKLPILNNSDCEMMYERVGIKENIPHIFICAGYQQGGKDSCDGDSGGPLVTQRGDGRFVLRGIVSFGRGCGERNHPGVYTRVSEFTGWINSFLLSK